MLLLVLLGLLGLLSVGALSSPSSKHPVRVAVAGAGSGVGLITFKKLLSRRRFSPIAIVSNKQEYKALKKLGAADEQIRICDITQKATLAGVFGGAEKVVICSAAAPKRRLAFRIKNFFRGLVGRHKPPLAADLFYEKGRRPYEVDYLGQRNVVDECLRSRVGHVVLLGSMGGYRGSRLNLIGRSAGDDLRNGNTLKWKRSSERYLMKAATSLYWCQIDTRIASLLQFASLLALQFASLLALQFASLLALQFASLLALQFASLLALQFASLLALQFASLLALQFASLLALQFASLLALQFASLHVIETSLLLLYTIFYALARSAAGGCARRAEEVIWDTDDALLRTVYTKISREDAAEAVVQALMWKEAIGRSIDIASKSVRASDIAQGPLPPRGDLQNDWLRFWSRPGNCVYPASNPDDLKFN
eukprot:CAMPEP_0173364942 /NCGR_PEP_ID=MMETSP1144-20121109/23302_1 /TAXON_ID=483371 /ORGANISM="non described non described, Strain CCMP2298" /LENGTH=423 /DNA_ID=CAMNT_0014315221 /DNA_START=98 /DNA_END=1371 /DNA_ORIENTATION=-